MENNNSKNGLFIDYLEATGDRKLKLRNELVTANLGIVYLIVSKIKKRYTNWITEDDLVQIGTIALINAVEHFDPYRNLAFSTYAYVTVYYSLYKLKCPKFLENASNYNDNICYCYQPQDDLLDYLKDTLTDKEYRLIYSIFYERKTCKEIANKRKVSTQYIHFCRQKILRMLRERLSRTT